jgi:hypothetical protein
MTTDKQKMLIIIGAGFSKALNEKMPLTSEIIPNLIRAATARKDSDYTREEYLRIYSLAHLACFGFLGDDAPLKESGYSVKKGLEDLLSDMKHRRNLIRQNLERNGFAQLKQKHIELLDDKDFQKIQKQDEADWLLPELKRFLLQIQKVNGSAMNIEQLLAEEDRQGFHNSPYALQHSAFTQIAFDFLQEGIDSKNDALAKEFVDYLKNSSDKYEINFLSFNYDLILESLLAQLGWLPKQGYSIFYNKESPTEQKKFQVYKPHGSLNWKIHDLKELVLDHPDSVPDKLQMPSATDDPDNTVLMPPTPNKYSDHPELYRQDQDIKNLFRETDHVVIIGWGCPESDVRWATIVNHIFEFRDKQLASLTHINPDQSSFDRARSMLRPKSSRWIPGFQPRFSNHMDDIDDPVINGSLLCFF